MGWSAPRRRCRPPDNLHDAGELFLYTANTVRPRHPHHHIVFRSGGVEEYRAWEEVLETGGQPHFPRRVGNRSASFSRRRNSLRVIS